MKSGLLLVICLLEVWSLHAQRSNADIYQWLWEKHLDENAAYRKVSGQILPNLFPTYEPDTSSSLNLQVFEPQVYYTQLADKRIKRRIEIPYNLKDSLIQSHTLLYVDTLQREDFKEIHRKSQGPLRGENPTFAARWLKPVAILSLSVGGIIALFYVRSS